MKSFLLTLFILKLPFVYALPNTKPVLKLLYFEREPLYIQPKITGGKPSGIIIDTVKAMLINYSGEYSFSHVPAKRQLSDLQDKENKCGVGWFKNNLREESYKFSYPIFFDGEMYLLGNSSQKMMNFKSISELLSSKTTKVLINSEFSYGEILDKLFKDSPNVQSLSGKQSNIVGMIDRSRGHFTVVSSEEKNFLEKSGEYKNIYFVRLKGMSSFSARYLMCSKGIDTALFEKLNLAILNYYNHQRLELVDNTK